MSWDKKNRPSCPTLLEEWQKMEQARNAVLGRMKRLRLGLLTLLLAALPALALLHWRTSCVLAALALAAAITFFAFRRMKALTRENDRLVDAMDALADRMKTPKVFRVK